MDLLASVLATIREVSSLHSSICLLAIFLPAAWHSTHAAHDCQYCPYGVIIRYRHAATYCGNATAEVPCLRSLVFSSGLATVATGLQADYCPAASIIRDLEQGHHHTCWWIAPTLLLRTMNYSKIQMGIVFIVPLSRCHIQSTKAQTNTRQQRIRQLILMCSTLYSWSHAYGINCIYSQTSGHIAAYVTFALFAVIPLSISCMPSM